MRCKTENYDNALKLEMKIANDRCLVIDYNNPPRLQVPRKRANESGLHKSIL